MKTKTKKTTKTTTSKSNTPPASFYIPRKRGHIYCAPFCGGKCTWSAYQRAVEDSAKWAKKLGPDWTPHVWENLGWHWKLIDKSKYWKLHMSTHVGEQYWTAMLGEGSGGTWIGHGKTALAAFKACRRSAHKSLMHYQKMQAANPEIR